MPQLLHSIKERCPSSNMASIEMTIVGAITPCVPEKDVQVVCSWLIVVSGSGVGVSQTDRWMDGCTRWAKAVNDCICVALN